MLAIMKRLVTNISDYMNWKKWVLHSLLDDILKIELSEILFRALLTFFPLEEMCLMQML